MHEEPVPFPPDGVWLAVDRGVERLGRDYRLSAEDAEECAQTVRAYFASHLETLLAAWQKRGPLQAYVDRIVKHQCIDWLRARRRALRRFTNLEGARHELGAASTLGHFDDNSPEVILSRMEATARASRVLRALDAIIETLPPHDRALLVARFWKRMTMRAIAAECGRTHKSVSHQLDRLLPRIKQQLVDLGIDERAVREVLADPCDEAPLPRARGRARPPSGPARIS